MGGGRWGVWVGGLKSNTVLPLPSFTLRVQTPTGHSSFAGGSFSQERERKKKHFAFQVVLGA